MGTERIPRLMARLALPSIAAQIINVLYSVVDRVYIGHIPGAGEDALTGVGVALPIIVFISAFAAFAGAGGAPLAAIHEGKGDHGRAERILGNSAAMLLAFSALSMGAFYPAMRPLLRLFGASEDTIGYGASYLSVYLIGTPFVMAAMGLNAYIIAQGAAGTGMLSVLIGAVVNIALDPVFIFALHGGVAGAAWATVVSQLISAVWVTGFLVGRRTRLRLRLRNLRPDLALIGRISSLGVSPFVMQATESLVGISLNSRMHLYGGADGDLYVASLTVMQSMLQLLSAPLHGFTTGVQPIMAYNFGAGRFDRVRRTYRSAILLCFSFSLVFAGLIMLFPEFFASLFTDSAELIRLCGRRMPVFLCGMTVFGLQMGIQPTFIALGQARISVFIACLRKVVLLIPLAFLLPAVFRRCGLDSALGVYLAEPISDFISALTAAVLFAVSIRRIMTRERLDRI